MTDFLDRLEHQLVQAAAAPDASRRRAGARGRGLRLPLVAAVLLLASATIALAASGLLTGSAVRPSKTLTPTTGEGVPAPGGARLLPLRVADPAGGLPWGMRIVHTTRGLVCLQIGRVQNGELGELGIDGAYHDDGLFHPVPPAVLPVDAGSGVAGSSSCQLAGRTFSGSLDGLDRNAATSSGVAAGDQREISYGLLGAHALSITYTTRSGQRTTPVQAGTGAYLVVGVLATPQVENMSGSIGVDQLDARRPNPIGALSAITYRFGARICEDSPTSPTPDACPRPNVAFPVHPAPLPNLHDPVQATLDIRHGLIYGAKVQFTAPYAATSARETYGIAMPIHGTSDTVGSSINRNVTRGEKVTVHLPYVFADTRVGRSQLVEIVFTRLGKPPTTTSVRQTIVGSLTLREPPGTAPAPPPVGPRASP